MDKDFIFSSRAIRVEDGLLSILDQTLLPHEERWIPCRSVEETVDVIRALKVRGAPAIGIAALLFLGTEILRGTDRHLILAHSSMLRESRPTAVNLMNYLDRLNGILEEGSAKWREEGLRLISSIFYDDVELCEGIANHGLTVLPIPSSGRGLNILTHCNTGSLATAGRGTALGIIVKAHEVGREVHVWVDETRPLLQGARLTAWELAAAHVPHTLICDNMAGLLMSRGQVDCVIVGADRIARNGDFANKIGTYTLAVLAKYHGVPFYVAAPETTYDESCPDGSAIPIEQRHAEEVRGFVGRNGQSWSPNEVNVYNPAFDVTPASLVTGWIFDSGVRVFSSENSVLGG